MCLSIILSVDIRMVTGFSFYSHCCYECSCHILLLPRKKSLTQVYTQGGLLGYRACMCTLQDNANLFPKSIFHCTFSPARYIRFHSPHSHLCMYGQTYFFINQASIKYYSTRYSAISWYNSHNPCYLGNWGRRTCKFETTLGQFSATFYFKKSMPLWF